MASTTSVEERAEIYAVLDSGLFLRAPNLENFFRYVCECHIRGEADQLKEYSIAVEALGRTPQFDSKRDSIVRVEAHRLRKRLADYYAGAGADHKIHITIPRGSYVPEFLIRETPPEAIESVLAPVAGFDAQQLVIDSAPVLPPKQWRWNFLSKRVAWLLGICAIVAAAGLLRWQTVYSAPPLGNEVWKAIPGEEAPAEFHMLAGYHGAPLMDAQGREWQPDAFYSGGRTVLVPKDRSILGLPSPGLIKSSRAGKFEYAIPVREGVYELHLYFAETEFGFGNPRSGGDNSRLFRLLVNGGNRASGQVGQQINLFDVHAQAGGANRLLVRVFKDVSRQADGKIHVAFDPISEVAFVNAIEILPSASGRIRPVRIVAQEHSVTDADGHLWSADEYVVGGTMVLRHNTRFQDRNSALYQGERFGNFCYHIPLAPGKYRLTLHFAETFFGTPSADIDRQEHRLFDVYANGVALVRQLDVLGEAGAPNRGIEHVYEGLEPSAQGELTLQFVPVANYAEVNAIEVVETE